jgi:phage shock protein C
MGNLGLPVWHHWWGWSWDVVVATLFILAGVALVFGGRNGLTRSAEVPVQGTDVAGSAEPGAAAEPAAAGGPASRMHRSRANRKFLGVCGGMGEYFNVDPTIVRLLAIAAAFASFGIALIAYFLLAIVLPNEPLPAAPQPAV